MEEESDINKPPVDGLWVEPEGPTEDNTPKYPYNNVTQTESGHSFEMDDTPGFERVRIQHRSGSFTEFNANGDVTTKIIGNGFEIIAGNKNVQISGTCNIQIDGDCNLNVKGDMNQLVEGDYNLIVQGETNFRSVGEMYISGDDDVSIAANENFGGSLRLSAAENLYLNGDLNVGGSITCDTLTAESRVNAGMGVVAGPYGFTSATGGLSLGYPTPLTPVATPGSITCVGSILAFLPITSLSLLAAPFATVPGVATIGLMDAVWMTDAVNTSIYDSHIHMSPRGLTSPPLMPMI
jgi:hypothetical protein